MTDRDGNIRGIRGRHGPESVNVINWNGISRASSTNGQANARLLAAAPDLLEAVMGLLVITNNLAPEAQKARAAVMKAVHLELS